MRDPQFLAQCLVEGDAARVERSRRVRRKALVLSLGVEAMLLAALLLAPLASPETLSRRLDWSPAPPYRGVIRLETKPPAPHPPTTAHHSVPTTTLYQPNHIPTTAPAPASPDDAVSSPSSNTTNDLPGFGDRVGLPGGFDPGPRTPPPLPQDPPRPPRIVRKSEGAQAALLEHRVVPVYPPLAIQTRTQGEVKLRAIIATDGTIRSLEVESGHPLLILAARDAVQQWRYKPAVLNGQPVEVDTFITVIFHLEH